MHTVSLYIQNLFDYILSPFWALYKLLFSVNITGLLLWVGEFGRHSLKAIKILEQEVSWRKSRSGQHSPYHCFLAPTMPATRKFKAGWSQTFLVPYPLFFGRDERSSSRQSGEFQALWTGSVSKPLWENGKASIQSHATYCVWLASKTGEKKREAVLKRRWKWPCTDILLKYYFKPLFHLEGFWCNKMRLKYQKSLLHTQNEWFLVIN